MTTLLLGWLTFIVMASAPGPSTFAIMGVSLEHGRGPGLSFASGVCTGSVFWGLVSAAGVGALLQTVGWALVALKLTGGAYLLWMAWKAARAAMADTTTAKAPASGFYLTGLGLHLTNPKAVFGWAATIAVGLPPDGGLVEIALFLSVCAVLAVIINLGYALAFSTQTLATGYRRIRRWIQGSFAALFAAAGIGLIAWRP